MARSQQEIEDRIEDLQKVGETDFEDHKKVGLRLPLENIDSDVFTNICRNRGLLIKHPTTELPHTWAIIDYKWGSIKLTTKIKK